MNMPFHKSEPAPARVVVEVDQLNRLIAEVDNCRIEVARAIALLASGRTTAALETLQAVEGRLG